MNIFIYNDRQTIEPGSISELLKHLDMEPAKGIALAVNERVIPKTEWKNTPLSEGDRIILIKATQGG